MDDKIYVTKPFLPELEEYMGYLGQIWENGRITNMGAMHQQLESALTKYLGVPHTMLFSNGHNALELLIEAMELKGEVITTPYTFVSTSHAIVRNDLTPVFCDIRESDYTIDPNKIEELITDKTSAIIAVHVYGYPCDVEAIQRIARKYNLKVIYDAAHAFGEKIDGLGIGLFGDASMFSLHATKAFHTIEGGAVVLRDFELGYKLFQLRNFGITGEESLTSIGTNAKMSELHAAMGLCNMNHIEEIVSKRRALTERYEERLMKVPGIRFVEKKENVEYGYAYMPIVINEKEYGRNRDELCFFLNKKNIFPRKYFFPLVTECSAYKEKFVIQETPVAKYISENVLTLPLYPDLSLQMVDEICNLIVEYQE